MRDVGAEVAGQVALVRRRRGRDDAAARPARGPAARRGSRRRRLPRARRPSRRARSGRWCAAGARRWCPAARTRARWCRRPRPAARTSSPGGPAPARRTRRRAPARPPGARPSSTADHLGARHERQRLRREVVVGGLVGVGVVDAGRGHVEQLQRARGLSGAGRSTSSSTSGPPNCLTWIARIGTDPNRGPRVEARCRDSASAPVTDQPSEPTAASRERPSPCWSPAATAASAWPSPAPSPTAGDQVAVTYRSGEPPEGLFGVRCDVTDADVGRRRLHRGRGSSRARSRCWSPTPASPGTS